MVDEYNTKRRYARSARYLPVLAGILGVAAASILSPRAAAQGSRQPKAGEDVPGEILVGYRNEDDGARASAYLNSVGHEVSYQHAIHMHHIKLAPGISADNAIAALNARSDVLYAVHNHYVRVASTPNDPYFATSQWAPQKIQADLAWGIWSPKTQVIVAIIDSGVDSTNPDLTNVMDRDSLGNVIGYDAITGVAGPAMDVYGHGTHCAGIAAAQVDNGIGIAGIAGWNGLAGATSTANVKIMPVQVIDSSGTGTDASVAAGITWAVQHGAKVISLSLGEGTESAPMQIATSYAWTNGALVCAAAGNNGSNAPFYPAANPNVISVAATDPGDNIWAGVSDYGSWVTIAAPGWNIYSTLPTYAVPLVSSLNYGLLSGTSMAAPHVAGAAAVLFAQNPALTNQEVSWLLTNNVDTYNANGCPIAAGAGRLNVYKALQAAQAATGSPTVASVTLSPSTTTGGTAITGTITMSGPILQANGYATISTNSSLISVPGGVPLTAGLSVATFNLTTSTVTTSVTIPITVTFGSSSQTTNLTLLPNLPTSASFVKRDTTTNGNWKGVYGSAGEVIQADSSTLPTYALMSLNSASTYTWNASDPSDARVLLKDVSTTDRVAACWYSGTTFNIDVILSDGLTHQVALYALDFDKTGRAETVKVINAQTGTVLDTETLSAFETTGTYLVWNVQGHVQFQVTNSSTSSACNAVVSGIFLDPTGQSQSSPVTQTPPVVTPPSSPVTPTPPVASPPSNPVTPIPVLPTIASMSVSPTTIIGGSSATGTITLTAATTSTTTVSLLAGNSLNVPATVTIPAGSTTATFSVATSAVVANTTSAVEATYNGASVISLVNLTVAPVVINAASYVGTDSATAGNWKGVYGASGYVIEGDSSSLPSFATLTVSGDTTYTWQASVPSDTRCLLKGASTTDRIAACWYSGTSFTYDVNLTDGQVHKVSLYALDYDRQNRAETIQVINPSSGSILNSQTVSAFSGGKYLTWVITGHVQFVVTNNGLNAVLSGLFIDPPSSAATPAPVLTGVTFAPSTVTGGSQTTGTVALSAPVTTTTTVTLATQSTAVSLPASVTVPAGQSSATFTVNSSAVTTATSAAITATALGTSMTGTVTLNPTTKLTSIAISPSTLSSGGTATGTATLSGPATASTVVAISSSNSALSMPASVTIAAGQTSATFTVTANTVAAATTVTVTGTLSGASTSASVTVNPTAKLASIVLAQATLTSGSTGSGTATLSAAPTSSVVVTLASSNSALTVPTSVSFAAGQTSATFTVTANSVTAATPISVSGTLNGGAASASMTVNPVVRVNSVSISPSTVAAGTSASGTVTLTGPATSAFVVTLSSSSSYASVPTSVTIAAGQASATFTVATSTAASATTATVTASANSYSVAGTLTITPVSTLVTATTATFVKLDTTTLGNWRGAYGSGGYAIEGSGSTLPSFAAATVSGDTVYTWEASDPSNSSCLLVAGTSTNRIAACWYSNSTFTIDVPVSDGKAHQIALYCLDFDKQSRAEQIQVVNPATGAVLSTQSMSAFTTGQYAVWNVTGHVQFRITCAGGANAVVSGFFVD